MMRCGSFISSQGGGMIDLDRYQKEFQLRQEARMKLPLWLRLLMPLLVLSCVFGLAFGLVFLAYSTHGQIFPGVTWQNIAGHVAMLIFAGGFIAALAPGIMLANRVLKFFGFTRRVLDKNAEGVPDYSYEDSMRGLKKIGRYSITFGLILLLFAIFEPWRFL
jgi:hypothetical protein